MRKLQTADYIIMPRFIPKHIVYILSIFFCLVTVVAGLQLFMHSTTFKKLARQYSRVNHIEHGILSVEAWRNKLTKVVTTKIDSFNFSAQQQDSIIAASNSVLYAMLDKVQSEVEDSADTFPDKIRNFFIDMMVDFDKIRQAVPEISQRLLEQIKNPEVKRRLKFVARDKMKEFAETTKDSTSNGKARFDILQSYDVRSAEAFNEIVRQKIRTLRVQMYNQAFVLIGCIIAMMLLWWFSRDLPRVYRPLFNFSLCMALCVLLVGVLTPMIEIDARLQKIEIVLLAEPVTFTDQVIFYRNKSIVDVVVLLVKNGTFDALFVGFLIAAFSVVFPLCKLTSNAIVFQGCSRVSKLKIVKWFAFKSGKWSMADVFVVAIFMAYIGFKNIIDSQLSHIELHTETLQTITTNNTALQPGYLVFIAFVLFSLSLSIQLKKIPGQKKGAD